MSRNWSPRLASLFPCFASLVFASTGCQALPSAATLNHDITAQAPAPGMPPEASQAVPNHCVVVLRDAGSESSQRVNIDLAKETHIQDALVRAGALKRYRRMDIQLIRTSPSGAKHRMGVEFDRGSRKVAMQSDYAVQHGDVLLVEEDPTTTLDDMLGRSKKGKSSGGLGAFLGG